LGTAQNSIYHLTPKEKKNTAACKNHLTSPSEFPSLMISPHISNVPRLLQAGLDLNFAFTKAEQETKLSELSSSLPNCDRRVCERFECI